MYSALSVADYVVKRCNEKKYIVSNLKLQKILYFIQAEFLVVKNQECFSDRIEAWDFGPVVPSVYQAYKIYGNSHIPENENERVTISSEDKELMNGIIDDCARYSASYLVEVTHHQRPWLESYQQNMNNVISSERIKAFFNEA